MSSYHDIEDSPYKETTWYVPTDKESGSYHLRAGGALHHLRSWRNFFQKVPFLQKITQKTKKLFLTGLYRYIYREELIILELNIVN